MWLIVGLGNPGEQYAATRHNVGFWVIDELFRSQKDSGSFQNAWSGLSAKVSLQGEPALLLKPQTYMNRSGESVQPAAAFYKISPDKIIVIHDDMDLPLGDVRVKRGGGHGGHNGLRDIIGRLGPDFIRVRFGIGKPAIKGTEADYVLSGFSKKEQDTSREQIHTASEAVGLILEKGVETAQQKFNGKKV